MSEDPEPQVLSYSSVGERPRRTLAVIALVCAMLGMVLTYLGGGPLGAVGVLLGAYALYRIRRAPSKYGGRVPAIASVCIGSVALVLGAAITLQLYLPPHFPRTVTAEQWCAVKMRGIVQCIHIYAQNHAGEFPPDLEALVAAGYGINKNMACPRTGRCYFLIPGAMGGEDANAPVLLEPPDSHSGGAHVAFADGRVILLASDEYARAAGGHLKTSKFLTSAEFDRKVNERLGLFRHRGQPSTALSSQPSSTRTATRPARAKRRFIWEDGRWSGEGEGSSP